MFVVSPQKKSVTKQTPIDSMSTSKDPSMDLMALRLDLLRGGEFKAGVEQGQLNVAGRFHTSQVESLRRFLLSTAPSCANKTVTAE